MDLDASKERGFGVVVYHIKGDPDPAVNGIKRQDIQPILFLSKLLTTAESHYWPTKLETACLVWTVKKVKPFVELAPKIYVFTDHAATRGIAKATSLSLSNSDKLNQRLIRAS